MEMKAPTTTAQPQPPSGGVYPWGPPSAGGMSAHEEEDDEDGDEISCSCWRTTGCRGEENPASRCTGVRSQNLWEKQSREPVKINTGVKGKHINPPFILLSIFI